MEEARIKAAVTSARAISSSYTHQLTYECCAQGSPDCVPLPTLSSIPAPLYFLVGTQRTPPSPWANIQYLHRDSTKLHSLVPTPKSKMVSEHEVYADRTPRSHQYQFKVVFGIHTKPANSKAFFPPPASDPLPSFSAEVFLNQASQSVSALAVDAGRFR